MTKVADGVAIPTGQLAELIAGTDGTNTQFVAVNSSGELIVAPGTAATSLGKAEDSPHTSGDVGVMMLGVRNDAGTARSDADGDYTPISVSSRGIVLTSSSTASAGADAVSNTLSSLNDSAGAGRWLGVASNLFNGTTWDRQRNNLEGTALASAARTASTDSADIVNYNGRGVLLMLNVTAASGTGGLQVRAYFKDPVSGAYNAINTAPTAVSALGLYSYAIYPGGITGGSIIQSTSQALPRTFKVTVTHGDGSSYTYSVGYSIIL